MVLLFAVRGGPAQENAPLRIGAGLSFVAECQSGGTASSGQKVSKLRSRVFTELNSSRRVCRRELTETSVAQTVIRVLELGVVERVEGLQPQLQPAVLTQGNGLEEREVPVVTTRSAQSVVAEIAPIAGAGLKRPQG